MSKELFKKIKVISNEKRFEIIMLTQNKELSITELSKELNLSYTKCADYVRVLEKHGIISKRKSGKEVLIKSSVKINRDSILFR